MEYPLLYMTGHHDFRWSDQEAAWLQQYLKAGGMLLADACCGRLAFHLAFEREMARRSPSTRWKRSRSTTRCTTPTTTSARSRTRPAWRKTSARQRPQPERDHPRRPPGGRLQPVRPGQRLGTVPSSLHVRV